MAATAGSRSAAVRNVPLMILPGCCSSVLAEAFPALPFLAALAAFTGSAGSILAPSDRGNSSYQEPNRARRRSTTRGSGRAAVTSSRSGWRASAAVASGASAAASRAAAGRDSSRSASAAASTASRPSRFGTPSAARSYSAAPSARTSAESIPAGILIWACWRQVVTGSLQASTVYVQRPSESGVTSAPQRSEPGASSRIGVHGPVRPLGSRRTALAATASWPSRKTVAVTWKVSPATAFAGLLPQSTSGRTSRTGMRPIMESPGDWSSGCTGRGEAGEG